MKTTKRLGFWVFILGVIFALLPVLSVLLSFGLTILAGCETNEGSAQACMFLGTDIGELLYFLFVAGWYALITLPFGGIAASIGLVVYVGAKIGIWMSKRSASVN